MAHFPVRTHNQKAVLGVALRFSVLAVIAVNLRLVAHTIVHKGRTSSNYLIVAACIFAVGLQSVSITGVFIAGIGYGHVVDIVPDYGLKPITKLLQLIIPLQFLWVLRLSCTKISILCLYLQVFPHRWIVWSSYATISIIVAWTVSTFFASCLICRPFDFNWDETIIYKSCDDQVTLFTVTALIHLITDVIVLLPPVQMLYQLQTELHKQLTVASRFGLGIFTYVNSALRISVLSSMDFGDINFTIPKVNIFSGIEPCLAVLLASIFMMRPLLGRSAPTPYRVDQKIADIEITSSGLKRASSRGFERLDEDTSDIWL